MEHLSTMGYGCVGDVVMLAHYAKDTDHDEWMKLIDFANTKAIDEYNVFLVLTGAGTITAAQRETVKKMYNKYKMEICLLTDSRFARGVLTALGWFGVPSQGYPPDGLEDALESLNRRELFREISRHFEVSAQRQREFQATQ